MRILFLTPQLPYPPHQGTALRNYNLIANLAVHHEIHLLSFVCSQDDMVRKTPLHRHCERIETVLIPNRSPWKRFFSLFLSPLPDMALRLPSAEFVAKLRTCLERERFDVVQIEGIEMAQAWLGWKLDHERQTSKYPISIFDDHNAEYVLQKRAFETDIRHPTRWVAAFYSLIQWKKLSRYESMICRLADGVVAVSETDRRALQHLVPGLEVTVVPNGVDTEFYTDRLSITGSHFVMGPHSLVFTGKMDFRPNVDAVLWFYREVLPLVRREAPDVHFYIVGQSPHRRLLRLSGDPAVTITGYVDDVRPYIAGASVYVVPLRIGGGTRLKVLEAMAMGKAIVSTSLGCEGFEGLVSGRQLLIADTPQGFARRVLELLDDAPRRERLGRAARRFVEERYDWRIIVPRLEQLYELQAGLRPSKRER